MQTYWIWIWSACIRTRKTWAVQDTSSCAMRLKCCPQRWEKQACPQKILKEFRSLANEEPAGNRGWDAEGISGFYFMLLFLLYCHNYSGLLSLVVVWLSLNYMFCYLFALCWVLWILSLKQLAFSIAIVPTLRYPHSSSGHKHQPSLFHGSSPTLDSQGHIQINHWPTDWTACDGTVRSPILGRMVAPCRKQGLLLGWWYSSPRIKYMTYDIW